MRLFLTVLGVLLIGSIILSHQKLPSILPQVGVKAIITSQEDCMILADFCASLADKIDQDGLLPEGERKISTPFELEDMRKSLADEKLFSLGRKYPKLPECLGAYLDKIPHEDELSPEGRKRWSDAFREISREAAG